MIFELDKFKSIIHEFYLTNNYLDIYSKYNKSVNIHLLDLLKFSIDKESPQKIQELSKKIIINILKNNIENFEQLFNEFIEVKNNYLEEQYEKIMTSKLEKVINFGDPLIDLENNEDPYWKSILHDMIDDDFDEITKNLLLIREEMIKITEKDGQKSNYSKDNINEYIDLEYIKSNLFYKQYNFDGLFYYIYHFLYHYLNPAFKKSLDNSLKNFIELLKHYKEQNEKIVYSLKFLMDHFFIYIEMNNSIDIMPIY